MIFSGTSKLKPLVNLSLLNKFTKFHVNRICHKNYSKSQGGDKKEFVVTVIGSSGGIGQMICYGLKFNPCIKELRMYDCADYSLGVALDLSHITSKARVQVYCKKDDLCRALDCTDVVVITASVKEAPGADRAAALKENAKIIEEIIPAIARASENAHIAIVTNPVNSLVPYASVLMKKNGICNIKRLYGVTTVDTVRARALLARKLCVPMDQVQLPVIGGHSKKTTLPLLSQDPNGKCLEGKDIDDFIDSVIYAARDVTVAKKGTASTIHATGYATSKFVHDIVTALTGKEVTTTAYVSSCLTDARFFSSQIKITKEGVTEALPLPKLREDEECKLKQVVQELCAEIQIGLDLAKKNEC